VIVRALVVLGLLALVEVGQGILRVRFVNRRLGDRRARQLGVVTGCVWCALIAWGTLPWIGARSAAELLAVGGIWMAGMLALDLAFGRLVFRVPWARIGREFNPHAGGWLAFGMVAVGLMPLLVGWLRGWWA
jgi:hypothetical protein